jgi:hypothetical protein
MVATTVYPDWERATEVASPMPADAPVTTATLGGMGRSLVDEAVVCNRLKTQPEASLG